MTREDARAYFIDSNERIISVVKDENSYNYKTQQIEDVFMRRTFEANEWAIKALEQGPETCHCKDCKWWKDGDGVYRRGVGAESQCPINRREVFEGNGYCYMFEPLESEDKE